jgi:uncharacterized membrane protein (UPF0127 family)
MRVVSAPYRPGRLRVVLAGAIVTALLLGACGGDDDGESAGADTTSETTAEPTTTASPGAPVPSGPETVTPAELLEYAGQAPAARGAGLDEPPGDPERTPLEGFAELAVSVTGPDGEVTGWCLLAALVAEQRSRGLMEVTDLGGYAGMIFVYDVDDTGGYYMRNTPTPLTIAWIDAAGELVSTADMEPCENREGCPTYSPTGSYRFAVEVPQGELGTVGIEEGSRIAVGGECAARA